jgi:hypothetical protein
MSVKGGGAISRGGWVVVSGDAGAVTRCGGTVAAAGFVTTIFSPDEPNVTIVSPATLGVGDASPSKGVVTGASADGPGVTAGASARGLRLKNPNIEAIES